MSTVSVDAIAAREVAAREASQAQAAAAKAAAAAVPTPARRNYLDVVAELAAVKASFAKLHIEAYADMDRVKRREAARDRKMVARARALNQGLTEDDLAEDAAYNIPPPLAYDADLQARFHQAHYLIAALEAEEAAFTSVEKGLAYRAAATPPTETAS